MNKIKTITLTFCIIFLCFNLVSASKFVLVGHLYSFQNESLMQDRLVKQINGMEDLDAVIFMGDIVKGATQEEWDDINKKVLSKLKADKLFLPGNHDTYCFYIEEGGEKCLDIYLNNTGYLSKKVVYKDSILYLLDSVNGKPFNFSEIRLIEGGGLSNDSMDLLRDLNPNKNNLIFLHHSLFLAQVPGGGTEIRISNEKEWDKDVVPLIKDKVLGVFMGDGNLYKLGGHKYGTYYFGHSLLMTREDISYVVLEVDNNGIKNIELEYIEVPSAFAYKVREIKERLIRFFRRGK